MSKKSIFFFSLALLLISPSLSFAQEEGKKDAEGKELRQDIDTFLGDQLESHEKKSLNLRMRDIGSLENEPYAWKEFFRLETKDEYENTLGYTTEREYYFLFYHYETVVDRQYALKYWLESFIEGESIRPGRGKRTYDYAKPTIILINPTNIIIMNYDCKYYDDYDFEDWRDRMIKYFGDKDSTIVIELKCDGPLEWTLNAPDPKNRELF
tara:strand:- start:121 stop:750 length:630 start_codon:yes stop_codon:yes gene_type:complete